MSKSALEKTSLSAVEQSIALANGDGVKTNYRKFGDLLAEFNTVSEESRI
ncbi:BREX-1 system adenine-specific DNA-methyltransferase PglX [Pseudomonadales bacterium]|nr:BREX-1 system adenine-specific DNA-methyltransferase PglX [Pseudomonadales bacterium]MDB9868055.1 BREX-1 system adenine-specific DNA-methyltransferase PglX [Pseudomonadales bacterium]